MLEMKKQALTTLRRMKRAVWYSACRARLSPWVQWIVSRTIVPHGGTCAGARWHFPLGHFPRTQGSCFFLLRSLKKNDWYSDMVVTIRQRCDALRGILHGSDKTTKPSRKLPGSAVMIKNMKIGIAVGGRFRHCFALFGLMVLLGINSMNKVVDRSSKAADMQSIVINTLEARRHEKNLLLRHDNSYRDKVPQADCRSKDAGTGRQGTF